MNAAYSATNRAIVLTYWHIGKRIIIQEQNGKERAEYGKALLDTLADELTREYGKCYSKRNLQYYRKFYLYFSDEEIVNACVHNLTWTHFRSLLRVSDENARLWRKLQNSNTTSKDESLCNAIDNALNLLIEADLVL